MKLDLRFSDRPLEDLWCPALAAFVFQRSFLGHGFLAGLNAKLAGFLSHLEKIGFWTAEPDETLLLATDSRIQAEKLILKGLGDFTQYQPESLSDKARELGSTLDRIGISEFGIHVPPAQGKEEEYPIQIELAARHLTDYFFRAHEKEQDYLLKIIFSVDRHFIRLLTPPVQRLREHFADRFEYTVVVDKVLHET